MKKIFKWRGHKVEYSDEGQGAALVCVPAWASSMGIYSRFSSLVDKKKIRLIIVTLPGWGDAPREKDFIPTFSAYAQMLSEFIKHLKLKKYSILGYSAASGVILSAISEFRLHPQKVIFVSPFGNRQDFLEEASTRVQLNLFILARKLHFPTFIIKSFMLPIYIIILAMLPEYRKLKNIRHFMFITGENIRSDFTAITEPVAQSRDFTGEEITKNGAKFLIVYSKNEFERYINKFERLKKKIRAVRYINNGADHRHFAFQPELSIQRIESFILKA